MRQKHNIILLLLFSNFSTIYNKVPNLKLFVHCAKYCPVYRRRIQMCNMKSGSVVLLRTEWIWSGK